MKAEIDEEQLKGWLCKLLGCEEETEKEIKKCKEQKKELEKEKKKLGRKIKKSSRGSKEKVNTRN